MEKKKRRRADLLLVLLLLAVGGVIGLLALVSGRPGGAVQVRVAGEIRGTYRLDAEQTIRIEGIGGTNLLIIADGSASVTEADCPDKLCVHQKAISKNHEMIVCLPNKVVVEVTGSEENGFDSIAR